MSDTSIVVVKYYLHNNRIYGYGACAGRDMCGSMDRKFYDAANPESPNFMRGVVLYVGDERLLVKREGEYTAVLLPREEVKLDEIPASEPPYNSNFVGSMPSLIPIHASTALGGRAFPGLGVSVPGSGIRDTSNQIENPNFKYGA